MPTFFFFFFAERDGAGIGNFHLPKNTMTILCRFPIIVSMVCIINRSCLCENNH